MAVPTIALYASPPSSVCSTPYQCHSHASYDFDLNGRLSSSSSSTSSSSQKSIVGGLSSLFSSPAVKASYSTGTEDLGSLWHDRGDELSSSFRCSSLSSSLKRDHQSPVSVFQGPVSCSTSSSGIGSYSRSPPKRIAGDVCSIRSGTGGLFNGFVRHALGSCVDHDPAAFQVLDDDSRSSGLLDELTFNMEEGFLESMTEPYAKNLLLGAQARHKIFYDDFVVKAFYEAEKAHRGQVRASGDPYLQHCVETAVLLATIGANSTVVAAGLLHDTLDDTFMTYDYIFRTLGAGVADLVEGVWILSRCILVFLYEAPCC